MHSCKVGPCVVLCACLCVLLWNVNVQVGAGGSKGAQIFCEEAYYKFSQGIAKAYTAVGALSRGSTAEAVLSIRHV